MDKNKLAVVLLVVAIVFSAVTVVISLGEGSDYVPVESTTIIERNNQGPDGGAIGLTVTDDNGSAP